jgi:hypothetical protein
MSATLCLLEIELMLFLPLLLDVTNFSALVLHTVRSTQSLWSDLEVVFLMCELYL